MPAELGRLETQLAGRSKATRLRPSSIAASGADSLLVEGDLLGQRYQILRHLGQGGMGVVYRARDLHLGGDVAVKVLRADRQQEALLTRFRHEYYLMATLNHPRFVEVRDLVIGRAGIHCLVMEFVEGDDLDRLVPLSHEDCVQVIDQLCEALAFLHSRRYVHHDLKSNNVRITRDGSGELSARLLDFGIMENIGAVRRELAGTPAYLPPEVLFGAPADPRLDLYSLGTLAFELFTGYVPFDIHDVESFVQAKQVSPPDVRKLLVDAPPEVAELIADLMNPDPGGRPHDASVVRRRLRQSVPELISCGTGTSSQLTAPTYLKPTHLVGRDGELQQLLGLCGGDAGAPVLGCIRGDAGLGKTALLRELALRLRLRGAAAEVVSAETANGPFSVITAFLRALWRDGEGTHRPELVALAPQVLRILPDISEWTPGVKAAAPHADPVEDRRLLFDALCRWVKLVKGSRRVALLVDDAQSADSGSLEALRALHANRDLGELMLILALRPDVQSHGVALHRLLASAELDVTASPLDELSVGELLRGLFGSSEPYPKFCAELNRAGQGNPGLILELVRELVHDGAIQFVDERWQLPRDLGDISVATSLAEALARRVGQVGGDAQHLLDVLVVGRRPLDVDLITACSELSEQRVFAALAELRDADLAHESTNGVELVTGLSRRNMLSDIDAGQRAALHAKFGRLLERRYAGEAAQHAAELAEHFLHGGALCKARHYLSIAGHQLYEAQALSDARPLLEQLEQLLIAEGASDKPYGTELHSALLLTRHRLARLGVARDSELGDAMLGVERSMYLPEIRALRSGAPLHARLAELARVVGVGVLRGGIRPHTLAERLTQYFFATSYQTVLLAMKGDFGKSEQVAHTLLPFIVGRRNRARGAYAACRCITLTHQGLVARAERYGNLALSLHLDPQLSAGVDQEDVETGLGGIYTLMTVLYSDRGAPEGAEWLAMFEAFVESRDVERAWLRPNYLLARLQFHLHRGEVLRCREVEAEYKAMHAKTGGFNSQIEMKIMVALARTAIAARDFVGAEALCAELAASPKDRWIAHGWGGVVLAELWRQQRLLGRATAALDEAQAYAMRPGSHCYKLEMRALNTRAALELDKGDPDAARVSAQRALDIACDEQTRSEYEELWARRLLVFLCHEAGQQVAARRHIAALAALVSASNNPLFEAIYEKLVSDGLGVPPEVLLSEHRVAAERLFQRLGYEPETLGGSVQRAGTGSGSDSGAWWNQTTHPGNTGREQETVVATPESALLTDSKRKR